MSRLRPALAAVGEGERSAALSRLFIALFVLAYWGFAWRLERVDFVASPPGHLQSLTQVFPLFGLLSEQFATVAELLAPSVLRHFIPLAVGWWLAASAASRFLESFYDLADRPAGAGLRGRLASVAGGRAKTLSLNHASFAADRLAQPLLRVGGPGLVAVSPSEAAVTERNGRFWRVLGPGRHRLKRFEYVYAVLDLRRQERDAQEIPLVTGDGITIHAALSAIFQIVRSEGRPARDKPYPFEHDAARRAAYAHANAGDDRIVAWDELPLVLVADELQVLAPEYRLDELVFAEERDILGRSKLRAEMERRARERLAPFGVQLLSARIVGFKLPGGVSQQQVEVWRAHWERLRRAQGGEDEARAVEEARVARAEAEAIMLQAIAEGLQRAQRAGSAAEDDQLLALRLIQALDSLAHQPEYVQVLSDNLTSWLDNMLYLLGAGEDDAGAAEE